MQCSEHPAPACLSLPLHPGTPGRGALGGTAGARLAGRSGRAQGAESVRRDDGRLHRVSQSRPAGSRGGTREPGGLALAWDPKPAVGGSGTWPLMNEVPGAAGGLAGRVGEAGCAPHLLGAARSPARPPGELACRAHGWPTMQCAQALQSCPVSWPVRSRWAWLWPPCGRRLVVAGPLGRRGQFCSDCCLLAVSSQAPLQTGALARGLAVPQDAANLNVCSATEQGPRWRALGPSWGGPSAW